jgi:uncharacterized protein (DUF1499 family)
MTRTTIIAATLLVPAILLMTSQNGRPGTAPPGNLLRECPDSPNCVSSLSSHASRQIPPLRYAGEASAAFLCLRQLVTRMERVTVVTVQPGYLHVEFRTRLGFVDDVEFALEPAENLIHMRSASRHGYWDLGVNRRRLEAIRTAFERDCP